MVNGGKQQTTLPKKCEDAETMELLAYGAGLRVPTMIETMNATSPEIKPPSDDVSAVDAIAGAVSASGCSCGWLLSCGLSVSY